MIDRRRVGVKDPVTGTGALDAVGDGASVGRMVGVVVTKGVELGVGASV